FGPSGPSLPIVLYAGIVEGVGGVIALVGLWLMKRWGWLLTVIIAALSVLVAVLGLVGAPTPGKVVSAAIIVVNAVVLSCCCFRLRASLLPLRALVSPRNHQQKGTVRL
ncbi:MAG TPA: hypothetical protein VFU69_02350, partial [Ktedonobacterales bacterium]|nr:hypothetical protein [Ktedonobacterales bacterium]